MELELGHLLTSSGFTHVEVSVMFSPGFFCLLVCSFFLLFLVIYCGAFCLNVATNFFCIPVFCPQLGLYSGLLQSLFLFYNRPRCIVLFFSYISSLLLLFFLRLLF